MKAHFECHKVVNFQRGAQLYARMWLERRQLNTTREKGIVHICMNGRNVTDSYCYASARKLANGGTVQHPSVP